MIKRTAKKDVLLSELPRSGLLEHAHGLNEVIDGLEIVGFSGQYRKEK